jgi:hypothetical protein
MARPDTASTIPTTTTASSGLPLPGVEDRSGREQNALSVGRPSGTAFNAALTWFSSQPQRYAASIVASSSPHAAAIAANTIGYAGSSTRARRRGHSASTAAVVVHQRDSE